MKVQESLAGLKLKVIHHLLLCADDINLLVDNIDTMQKYTEALVEGAKETDMEGNTEKTKYMLLSCHQNTGQDHDIRIASRPFESVMQLKYLLGTVTNQNLIQKEIKRRLNLGNACYNSVQNLFFFSSAV
jgi:hypothetical protein